MADTDPQTDEQPLDDVDRRLARAFRRIEHIEQEAAPDGLEAHARKLSGERGPKEKAD
jgi:hypothetical protein